MEKSAVLYAPILPSANAGLIEDETEMFLKENPKAECLQTPTSLLWLLRHY